MANDAQGYIVLTELEKFITYEQTIKIMFILQKMFPNDILSHDVVRRIISDVLNDCSIIIENSATQISKEYILEYQDLYE